MNVFGKIVKLLILIDFEITRFYITQRLTILHDFSIIDQNFRDFKIINKISLKIYHHHVLFVETIDFKKKNQKLKIKLIDVNIIGINVILKIIWLKKINFLMNFYEDTWIYKNKIKTFQIAISNNDLKNILKTNVIFMSLFELKKALKNENQQIYDAISKKTKRFFVVVKNNNFMINFNDNLNINIFFFFFIRSSPKCLKKKCFDFVHTYFVWSRYRNEIWHRIFFWFHL